MTDERAKSAAMIAFTSYMDSHGKRKTSERYAIYERLLAMPHHFFIEDLYGEMEAAGYHVSRATIYNTVNMLVDAGLVRRHQFGNTPAQYEKISEPARHHHLVCTVCGKIREVVDPAVDTIIEQRTFKGFTPLYTELSIYGICRQCQRTRQQKKQKSTITE